MQHLPEVTEPWHGNPKGCQKKAIGSFEHVDNRNKDIFIFGKNLTDGLDDTTITVELEGKAKDYKRKAY